MATTDEDLWKVYANKLQESFLQGLELGPKNRLYIPPLNAQAILAGKHVEAPVTNFGVHKAGDALITANNPLFTPSNDSYADRCLEYLQSVQLDTNSDAGLLQVLEDKRKEMLEAAKEFRKLKAEIQKAWTQSDEKKDGKIAYADWVNDNYPEWQSIKGAMDAAAQLYDNVDIQVHGAGAKTLKQAKDNLINALNALQPSACNMPVKDALSGAGGLAVYAPKYNIDQGYPLAVQEWINTAADPSSSDPSGKATIRFSSKDSNRYDWESLGFEKTQVNASGGFWPFFSATYSYGSEEKHDDIKASESGSKLDVEISANGIKSFAISPDSIWNPGNVKDKWPNLVEDASPHLVDPMVQVSRVVVGYNVQLKVTMDKNTYEKVTSSAENAAKHDASATASLFGFRLNLGGSGSFEESNSVNWSNVTKRDADYTLVIPAANDTMPVLLGVVGTVLGQE
jgi:hypothetical protein